MEKLYGEKKIVCCKGEVKMCRIKGKEEANIYKIHKCLGR